MIVLSAPESRHAVKVLRLKKGEPVIVVDGLGIAYQSEIITASTSNLQVRVFNVHRNFGEPGIRLTLAAGLSAGGKFNEVVQRGTEIGVSRFIPLLTDKSKVKLDDPKRHNNRQKRLEKVALAAMKQCRRSYRPDISGPVLFDEYVKEFDDSALNIIFHTDSESRTLNNLEIRTNIKRVNLLVGPEAGFSSEEVIKAVKSGFIPVSLGRRILRTETAGPVVSALVLQLLGELS
jgi:16S rRNA (uracil1498-N3)-methyltransferase